MEGGESSYFETHCTSGGDVKTSDETAKIVSNYINNLNAINRLKQYK